MQIRYLHFDTIDSTNLWAKNNAANFNPDQLTCITASEQTAGKGRHNRNWISPKGLNLYTTFFFTLPKGCPYLAQLAQVLSLSCTRVLKDKGFQPEIKWPNDLIYQGHKLVGILAELNGELDRVNYLIVGVGVNINQTGDDFPPELTGIATSLKIITGQECSRRLLLQTFLKEFELGYDRLSQSEMVNILEYAKLHSATLGKQVKVRLGPERYLAGEALGLESDGSLLIRQSSGEISRIYSGDIIEKNENEN